MPEEITNSMPEGGYEKPADTPDTPAPQQKVISNEPEPAKPRNAAVGLTGQTHAQFPGEPVTLPSRGILYPENHPCRSGIIHVRPITTKEEEILATERLQRQGIALDMVMQRCIMTPGIDTMDLLSGDRTMIFFYLRAISYGPTYKFEARMKDGSTQMIETNVANLKIDFLDEDFQEPHAVNIDGVTYEFILSRGRHEQEVIRNRLRSKKNPNAVETTATQTLRNLIVSVNGDTDSKVISNHIDNMIAMHAHKVRKVINDVTPGPVLEEEVINDSTGELEEVSVQVTESFFRPDLDSD